jgi:hypothetical protein
MNLNKEQLLKDLYDYKLHLLRFLRHPLQEIQTLPSWTWQQAIVFLCGLSSLTGAISGFTEKKIIGSFFFGVFISPIVIFVLTAIATLFFYYSIQIFARQTVSWRKLFILISFANVPLIIFRIVSVYFPPITLFGLAFAAALIIVGLTTHFSIDKRKSLKLVGGLYLLFFLTWLLAQINSSSRFDKSWSPDRIEAPEVELGK